MTRPIGTHESSEGFEFVRPYGTDGFPYGIPGNKLPGYSRASLWDAGAGSDPIASLTMVVSMN